MSDVADRVKKIVVEHLGVDEEKVVETASFIDDLGADSLDTVELVMAFEEEFSCEIPDDAAEKIVTVKDAIDFIGTNSQTDFQYDHSKENESSMLKTFEGKQSIMTQKVDNSQDLSMFPLSSKGD